MVMECENRQCRGVNAPRVYPVPVVLGGQYGRRVWMVKLCPCCLEELYSPKGYLNMNAVYGIAAFKAQPKAGFFTRSPLHAVG